MLIALIIAMIFGGGSNSPFADPDLLKYIKKTVADQDRKEQIVDLAKEYKTYIKRFAKEQAEGLKEMDAMFANRETTRADFETFFSEWRGSHATQEAKAVEGRMRFQNMITEEEWARVLQMVDAGKKDPTKDQRKLIDKFKSRTTKRRAAIASEIADADRRETALKSYDGFQLAVVEYMLEKARLNYKDNDAIRNIFASEDDMKAIYAKRDQLRAELYKAYIPMHAELVASTKEEEWTNISKAVSKLF
ncbi:MAG: hypothetical protein AAGA85_14225 [Bacteroidota bacterium]